MIRRLDGILQGDYRTRLPRRGPRLPRPPRVRARGRRSAHRLERDRADGHAVRPPVRRGPRADRVAAARPVAVDGVRADRPAEGARPVRARDDVRTAPHAGRQPRWARSSSTTRSRRRCHPAASRNQVLALTRNLLRPPPETHGAVTDLTRLLETALRHDPPALARRPRLRLHHRAGLGAAAAAAQRAARGRRDPARRPSRVRASRRRRHRRRGRRDRASSCSSTRATLEFRRRLRAAGEEREAELRAATLRAGVDLYEVSTDDDLVTAFVRIVESRKRRRR